MKTKLDQLRELFASQPVTRSLAVVPETYDAKARTIEVIVATETPTKVVDYDRWAVVDEILLMDGGVLPEGRTQVPLLDTHDRSEVSSILGSLSNFKPDGAGAMRAMLSFASTAAAVDAETLVREGHLTDLSVGYIPITSVWIPEKEKAIVHGREFAGPVKVTSDWKIKETSLCPIGGDEGAMVRSNDRGVRLRELIEELGLPSNASTSTILEYIRKEVEAKAAEVTTGPGASDPTRSNTPQITKGSNTMNEEQLAALRAENKRELEALAAKFGPRIDGGADTMGRMLKDAVDLEVAPSQFRGMIFSKITDGEPLEEPASAIGLNRKEAKLFSISRALLATAGNDWRNAPFEREVLEATSKRIAEKIPGRTNEGNRISLPYEVQRSALELTPAMVRALSAMGINTRDLLVGTNSAGGYTVQTNVLSLIDVLRNRLVLRDLGVTIWEGLTGQVDVPRHATPSAVGYVAENGAVSETNQVFETVQLRPKTVGAFTDVSRRLLMQSNVGIDAWVTLEIAKSLQVAIEAGAISGPGSGNAPTGILATSGIGSVAGGTNGLAPTWAHIVDLESEVAVDNADLGSLAYLTNAKVRGKLKKTFVDSGSNAERVWDNRAGDTPLNGYKGLVSNNVPSNLTKGTSSGVASAIIYGNWADLILAFWGVLDILVDPYTGGASGTLRIRELMDYDVAVRHPESFAAMQDALTV